MTQLQQRLFVCALSAALALIFTAGSAQGAKSQALVGQNDDGSFFIEVPVYFPPGGKRFFPKHRKRLKRVAKFLKAYPEIEGVQVVGYTDGKGPARKRDTFAGKRARMVKSFLVKQGIDAERLEAIAAEQDLKGKKYSRLEQRKMRRVEFIITKQPQPEPEPEPEADPEPELAPAPAAESQPTPEPVPEPVVTPEPIAEPEPALEPAPAPQPVPEPTPKPEPAPEPSPEPVPEPQPEPEPVSESAPQSDPDPEPATEAAPEPGLEESAELGPDYLSLDFYLNHPQHVAAAGTGIIFGVGFILGGMAQSSLSDMEQAYRGNNAWQAARDSAESRARMANIFYGLATLGAAGTGWLYYQAMADPDATEAETMVSVEPTEGGVFFNLQLQFH